MAYKNIHWIKLEKRLLNDYRFYILSEEAQLIYLKLLMLAAETNNKIPKNDGIIKTALRSRQTDNKIKECINEIKINFPKFKENKGFYHFKEWSNRCNWIAKKEFPSNSPATPQQAIDKNRIERIRKEYIAIKNWSLETYTGYGRDDKIIKTLLLKANDDNLVLKALKWIDEQGYSWTLETVIKKWADFMANKKGNNKKEQPKPYHQQYQRPDWMKDKGD